MPRQPQLYRHARHLALSSFFVASATGCADPTLLPAGDVTVFSGITLNVQASEYVSTSGGGQNANGSPPNWQLKTGVTVTINGGDAENQTEGLQIFADGQELEIISSAVSPPVYSAQYYPPGDGRGRFVTLLFRYQDASTSLLIEPLTAEITAPGHDSELIANDALEVRWTSDQEDPPSRVEVATHHYSAAGTRSCHAGYQLDVVTEGGARFEPLTFDAGEPLPCTGEVSLAFSQQSFPETPFAETSLSQVVARQLRFTLR